VYDSDTKSFRYFDKYQGRKLTPDKFIAGMRAFFCTTDNLLRTSIVRRFLDRIRELYAIHKADHPYRMYSSSLLFVYEGMPLDHNASSGSSNNTNTNTTTDSVDTPISPSVAASASASTSGVADTSAESRLEAPRHDELNHDCHEHVGQDEDGDHIELRMIDFAHTHRLESGHVQDDGYLFGLSNLIDTLETILQQDEQH